MDPLDNEVAKVVNGIAHGLVVERLDPPLRTAPPPGTEVKAQYALSSALWRKVVTFRLVVLNRSGVQRGETRKVMCRVGGGEFNPQCVKDVYTNDKFQVGWTYRCIS